MPRVKRLTPAAEWSELSTTAADWKAADPALLATMLGQLHLIRAFEETVLELAGEGLVHGPAHSSIGQEGGAVGSIVWLRSSDARQRLAPRPPPVPGQGAHPRHQGRALDLDALVTPEVAEVLQRTLAEILGLAQGYCAGRGGSMHLQWLEAGALGTNAIVGGGVPMAAGQRLGPAARSPGRRPDGTDLTVTYFGDGAVNIGSVLETLNLASAWKLPVCFFMENNGYAVSTTVAEATGEPRLSARALGFGITSWRVDGMDPLAVHLVMEQGGRAAPRRARARSSSRPWSTGSSTRTAPTRAPRSATGPRRRRPRGAPATRWTGSRAEMTRLGLIDEAGVAAVRAQAVEAMRAAAAALVEPDPAPGAQGRARGASARSCGPTRRSSTSASAATCRSWPGRGPPSARRSPARSGAGSSSTRSSAVMDRRMDDRPADRRPRRGRAQAQRRHQRRDQGPAREVPGPRPRHPDQRERLRRARRRARARRPVPAGRGVHVPGLPVGRRRPGVQPDRQGQAHVRRPEPGAAGAADEGRHGVRVRVAAPDGPGGHLRHVARLADHGRVHPVRLRRA